MVATATETLWWWILCDKHILHTYTYWSYYLNWIYIYIYICIYIYIYIHNTRILKMIVGVLTTCHTQYTWDRSICIFLFNRTTLQVFVTYLTGALYVNPLWFYKHQHDNQVRSKLFVACQRWWFQWRFAAILVNCAPSGEIHNYCTPHIIKENYENFLIHRWNYILLSQVYCVWQVVKTPTIILITLCISEKLYFHIFMTSSPFIWWSMSLKRFFFYFF